MGWWDDLWLWVGLASFMIGVLIVVLAITPPDLIGPVACRARKARCFGGFLILLGLIVVFAGLLLW